MLQPYPSDWPKPNQRSKLTLVNRITEAQKLALFNRTVTTRDLADQLGVREAYLSTLFPGKVPPSANSIRGAARRRRDFLVVRRSFRAIQAQKVIAKELTVAEAADLASIGYRTMARLVRKLREENVPS